jgi:hypothetical protein
VDLYLYRQTPTDPIDATVQAAARMLYMDHGIFRPVILRGDKGHYVLPIQFPMPGEWQVDVEIGVAGKQATLQVLMDVFD